MQQSLVTLQARQETYSIHSVHDWRRLGAPSSLVAPFMAGHSASPMTYSAARPKTLRRSTGPWAANNPPVLPL
jgi:hypothetical protein